DLMRRIAPEGPIYQAGTLSGNPLAMAAGLATIREVARPGFYEGLEATASLLGEGLAEAARSAGVEAVVNRVGSMLTLFFTKGPVTDFGSALRSDTARFGIFFRGMLARGVSLPPSQFEAFFVSAAHTRQDVETTLEAARGALAEAASA
ncbi:MAG TPA: aminotransferase class III-fold pyridoxal phosphate-dependent enzyme, partial [Candidatus Polarisedimenticolia bacterium]|nr:aminotransferase class III-fold pyridoxal phosphate-dependent enzyme [Candidatus Polarisedimenticolia bacterium]